MGMCFVDVQHVKKIGFKIKKKNFRVFWQYPIFRSTKSKPKVYKKT